MTHPTGHIPEHELLDYLEGALAPDREAVVAAALARDPRLARLVGALQADRRALVALGHVRAPEELAERIESILERQALLGLSDLGAASDPGSLPVSRLRPSRAPVIARIRRSPAGRALAAAAALALVAGGAVWTVSLVRSSVAPGPSGPQGPTIARNDPDPEPEPPVVPTPDTALAATTDDTTAPPELASDAPLPIEVVAAADAATSTAVTDAAAAIAAPSATAGTLAAGLEISAERAVELARRGRLAIVVSSPDTADAVARVDALAEDSGRVATWRRIDGGHAGGPIHSGYETVASLWDPNRAPGFELPSPLFPAGAPTTVASDTTPMPPTLWPGIRVPMMLPVPAAPVAPPAAVYAVTLEDRAGTLASLLSALRRDAGPLNAPRTARFVELPTPIDPTPAADPGAVLWWTGAPSAWTWRISVPVIVEQR